MIIAAEHLVKSFGGVKVLQDIGVDLDHGQALGIVGPNGAGKTTLLNVLTGEVRPDAGRVLLDGEDVTHYPAHRRCRAGIGRTHQIPLTFLGMTVYENVLCGAMYGSNLRERQARELSMEALQLTHLDKSAGRMGASLNLLDRKRLELARALATQPRVLLLDEIAGGLTQSEVEELVTTIKNVLSEGVPIMWIEHVMHALLQAIDRIVVMNFGEKVAEGVPSTVLADPAVHEIYLGMEAT
ncbi:MAG: ABC transporter ATP-binding protein [Actinobacteria bacterium]|nr:ABC transporter ATP-binding protein [Actinomycetota bacterium]MCL5736621.1 ABC transporter ATP-binding protein [Actinomycetota bacterium]